MSNRVRASRRWASSSLPWLLKSFEPLVELLLDRVDGGADPLLGQDEVLGRVDEQLILAADDLAAGGIDDRELLDFVAPELDAEGELLVAGQSSTQSPRTRNLPRANSMSLRSYWMSTSRRSTSSRSTCWPRCRPTIIAL